jgi:hypothetical protein
MPLNLITDRSPADVERYAELRRKIINMTSTLDEQNEWLNNDLKGAYNASDMNRVGNAINTLVGILNAMPQELLDYLASKGVAPDELFEVYYNTPITITARTDYAEGSTPVSNDLAEYLSKVAEIREILTLPASAPSLPSTMNNIGVNDANAIETILLLIEAEGNALLEEKQELIDNTALSWVFCGQPPCGLVNTQFS